MKIYLLFLSWIFCFDYTTASHNEIDYATSRVTRDLVDFNKEYHAVDRLVEPHEKLPVQSTLSFERLFDFLKYYVSHGFELLWELNLWVYFDIPHMMGRLTYDEDTFRNFTQLCDRYGFASEVHEVVTADGYINILHRLYKDAPYQSVTDEHGGKIRHVPKPAVIMVHGLEDGADSWILNGVEKSPGFAVAAAGYDVWITNSRGNVYSRGHVRLNESDPQYWNFAIKELAMYDMPAFIEYVRWKSGMAADVKVSLLAHS